MNTTLISTARAIGMAAILLAASHGAGAQAQTKESGSKEMAKPTGTTGATAFQPNGPERGEVEAGTGAQNGNGGMQQSAAKPGFDNKPPKGAKASCHQPQGGVDASGGENINSASKDNTSCTGKTGKKSSRR